MMRVLVFMGKLLVAVVWLLVIIVMLPVALVFSLTHGGRER